eukprot:Skav234618  [mRNA]  locus=scaffold835:38190:39028:+ [translate_table: standard]
MQAYNQCDPEEKRNLIAKYKAEGGTKNLAWVTTYVEKAKDQEINDNKVKKGLMLASEILKLNGIPLGHFDTKTEEKVLQGLLEDCYKQFGIDPANPDFPLKEEHPSVPQLNKFFFMKLEQSTTERNVFEHSMDLKMDLQASGMAKALASGAGSSTGAGVVKVENQAYLDLKQEIAIVQSMKTSVEKEFNKTETFFKDLEAEQRDDCKAADEIKNKITALKASQDVGTQHIDGLRSLLKRMRALQG